MASLSEQITLLIGGPITVKIATLIHETLTKRGGIVPVKSGSTIGSIKLNTKGANGFSITGNSNLKKLEMGDDPDIANRKYTQKVSRRLRTGKVLSYERSYTGMRPQKMWKKSAGGGNPWRVVPIYPRPPMNITGQAVGEALRQLMEGGQYKRILPEVIEITSLD